MLLDACVPAFHSRTRVSTRSADAIKKGRQFRITHMMETLARLSGDLKTLIAAKERDLSHAYSFLKIAEACRHARQRDLALDWAERGVRAFPERADSRLRELREYHHRKRHNEAMVLMWAEFTDSSSLDRYQKLKDSADRISRWPTWREKALAHLRSQTATAMAEKSKNRWGPAIRSDHCALVTIFLWEKDVESAWSEAKAGGCSNDLWLRLASLREKNRPDDVIPIYQEQIEPTLARKNNEAYREAVGLLRKICKLMRRLGKNVEFEKYLESVRVVHKAKRNFKVTRTREMGMTPGVTMLRTSKCIRLAESNPLRPVPSGRIRGPNRFGSRPRHGCGDLEIFEFAQGYSGV